MAEPSRAVGEPVGEAIEVADHVALVGDLMRLRQVAQRHRLAVDRPPVKGAEHQVEDVVGAVLGGRQEEEGVLAGRELGSAPDLEAEPLGIDATRHPHHQGAARDVALEHPVHLDQVVGRRRSVDHGGRVHSEDLDVEHGRGLIGERAVGHHHVGGGPDRTGGEHEREREERQDEGAER